MSKRQVAQPKVNCNFTYRGVTYKCIEDPGVDCIGCDFSTKSSCLSFECRAEERDDMTNVKFVRENT